MLQIKNIIKFKKIILNLLIKKIKTKTMIEYHKKGRTLGFLPFLLILTIKD